MAMNEIFKFTDKSMRFEQW